MTLPESIERAKRLNRAIWNATFSDSYPPELVTEKTVLLISYLDIALEHQSAITFLIGNGHRGSAMALVRTVFELLYRGAWVIAHADEEVAEKIRQDAFHWPSTTTLVKQADEAYGTTIFAIAKKSQWKSLNSFTHSGKLQVARRFNGNDLDASYPEDELTLALNSTIVAVGLLAIPFLYSIGRDNDAKKVETLLDEMSG